MARRLGEAFVEFKQRGMTKVTAASKQSMIALKGVSGAAVRAASKIARIGAGAALAATAAGVYGITKQLTILDKVAKDSDKLGIDPKQLSGLQFAMEQTGVSAQNGTIGIQRMTRRLADAAQKGGPVADTIAELGLNVQDLATMSPDEALKNIADGMKRIPNQADKIRIAFKLFDSEGVGLVNTLANGREGLEALIAEADDLGIGFDREELARIEEANDAFNRMKKSVSGLFGQLAVSAAPTITFVADKMTGLIKTTRGWIESLGAAWDIATDMFRSVADSIADVGIAMGTVINNLKQGQGTTLLEIQDAIQLARRLRDIARQPDPEKGQKRVTEILTGLDNPGQLGEEIAKGMAKQNVRGAAASVFQQLRDSLKTDDALLDVSKEQLKIQKALLAKPPVKVVPAGPALIGP